MEEAHGGGGVAKSLNGAGSKLSSRGHMGDKHQGVISLEIQNELSLSWVLQVVELAVTVEAG